MKLPKLSVTIALIAFSFNVFVAPLCADAPYKTSVGGGAYCECRKAPHLATTILLAGVLLGAIIAVAIKKPSDPNGNHSHSH